MSTALVMIGGGECLVTTRLKSSIENVGVPVLAERLGCLAYRCALCYFDEPSLFLLLIPLS